MLFEKQELFLNENSLMCANIRDFKSIALYIEREIETNNLADDFRLSLSKRIVSQFNLGIALELLLKQLLDMHGKKIPNHHELTKLYDDLPCKVQFGLEEAFQQSVSNAPQGYHIRAGYQSYSTPQSEKLPHLIATFQPLGDFSYI